MKRGSGFQRSPRGVVRLEAAVLAYPRSRLTTVLDNIILVS